MTLYHGSSRRALQRNAWGRPLRPPPQNPRPSGPHHDRYCTEVAWALAARWTDGHHVRSPCAVMADQSAGCHCEAFCAGRWNLLETDQSAWISCRSRWSYIGSSLPYTTAQGATGRGSQPSRSWCLQPRWLSSRPRNGWRSRPSGRSICLPQGVYRGQSLTWWCPTRSTRRICSFCHTTT